ncbi:ABC-type Fe3+-hydroxamate transport system substrate-binding protein [Rhizobium sp. SG_E_25_P2]|uniref:ABC transporter substrate-binding protein n=1 Tax=Rhizobium sp. SG_E_25_P2 TaxID=2879942 RepID=UPI0024737EF7|nr:ABC transporter substrate-binding protein [Rhizobium sp. SG_E_25_P2]MDH6265948.1 ABC-type Fe3+-hydroxamate transport system substrate-binding protein [Rhizobium sp. SG_E_25_P2]
MVRDRPIAPSGLLRRRALLVGGVVAACTGRSSQAAIPPDPRRIVALDWPCALNLLALGVVPLGLPERDRYRQFVVEPTLPDTVKEIGFRSEPNIELIASLRPKLILATGEAAVIGADLAEIAPVQNFDPDDYEEPDRLASGARALRGLAGLLAIPAAYESYDKNFSRDIQAGAARLTRYDGSPIFIASIIDARRMLVFGRNSLFQAVLDRWGVQNAWDGYTSRYGHATTTVDRLALRPEARLLLVGNNAVSTFEQMRSSPVMASLPFVRNKRVHVVPETLFYGGLPAAFRFARLASRALETTR